MLGNRQEPEFIAEDSDRHLQRQPPDTVPSATVSRCHLDHSDADVAQARRVRLEKRESEEWKAYGMPIMSYADRAVQRHRVCFSWAKRNQDRLALLSTCKGIYRSSSPLPFAENVFAFSDPARVTSFMSGLNAEQRNKIRNALL